MSEYCYEVTCEKCGYVTHCQLEHRDAKSVLWDHVLNDHPDTGIGFPPVPYMLKRVEKSDVEIPERHWYDKRTPRDAPDDAVTEVGGFAWADGWNAAIAACVHEQNLVFLKELGKKSE